jgi:hypothetical protein
MLMELAYRLAVSEAPFIQHIRKNLIVLLTPATEVDGRDRMVDLYNYRKKYPDRPAPNLVYWGKYVAHDNNRDSMSLSLALSRIVMKTFLEYHPQVLHDLHESVPFLYTSTGMGPYNAWLDPIVVNEWQKMAYHEIEEMTKRGVPGVWTHGFYDGWAPNYMFYAANGHNSIGRFYETFGNGGADTRNRTVPPGQTTRTWFRPNPPLPQVRWSLRNNVNMQQSGILFAMHYTATNRKQFLENFYLKSKRSVAKATTEGPAAWIIPADDPRPVEAAELMRLMQMQGVEVHKLNAETEVGLGSVKKKVPAGSYVIRMDQPYSRMADMLLDTQFYNINDPNPYDDTGWSLGPLRNVTTLRVTDAAVLKAPMTMVPDPATYRGALNDAPGAVAYLINHNADNTLATFRFRLRDVKMHAAQEPFELDGRKYNAGSFVIRTEGNPADLRRRIESAAVELGLVVNGAVELPKAALLEVAAPRIALVHSWINTQNEGWYRIAFDQLRIPYDYISDQKLRETADLRSKYDVIILGPTPGNSQRIVNGLTAPQPMPWKASEITPNFAGSPDQTDDMRGGMGLEGLVNVQRFIEAGGLMIFITGNSSIPIDYGLIEGVSIQPTQQLRARGSVLGAVFADRKSPVAYGYGEKLAVYFNQAPVFQVGGLGGLGGGAMAAMMGQTGTRPSGRGSMTDPDIVQGRPPAVPPPPPPPAKPGEDPPVPEEFREMMRTMMPAQRPRVVLRFENEQNLLVSGMLSGGRELAGRPAVIDVPKGKGHVLLFANNPMWRNETQGSYFLLFNAMLHYQNLDAGSRPATPAAKPSGAAEDEEDFIQ